MITKYYVSKYSNTPDPREFVRETEKCLFDKRGGRHLKVTSWETYHDTLEEAQAVIAERLEKESAYASKRRIKDNAEQLLEALEELLNGTFPNGVEKGFNQECVARYNKARAAIAAAKGEL